ncbi:tetratricopeptide repeat protein [Kitasatospora sp. NPDC015120]|uniref:tetratricopeptide repeat protein n=1 Tax=Kitasatospora sp. NPDC015120 TaxID=3364023 RepID=UPI0036F480C3
MTDDPSTAGPDTAADPGTADAPTPNPRGTFLAVVFDEYRDAAYRPIPGAVEQVGELAACLAEFGFQPTIVPNPAQGALIDGLDLWSDTWSEGGGGGSAVIAWSGHAETGNRGDLQLITHATPRGLGNQDRFYSPERLTSQALTSHADQILILLDTCHSGAGAVPALDHALAAWEDRTLPEPRTAWLGVLAACQAQERAEGARGLLLETVLELLRNGPQDSVYRHEWSVRNAGITGETLALAVLAEDWPDGGQQPVRASVGHPQPMFRNPRWQRKSREALVEHLVLAARGSSPAKEGCFFTGRRRALRQITDRLATDTAGMLLVTGSAGVGKSAVVGRIAALSDADERAALLAHAPLGEDDPDPGRGSVDAAVHLRGMDVQTLAEALARQLDLPVPKTPADLIAQLERTETGHGRRHVLVLDGLDEASPGQATAIAEQLLVPLSRLCAVLLASRDRPFQPHLDQGETLDSALTRMVGTSVVTLDLDEEHDTATDITAYVHHRLRSDGIAEETAAEIASALAARAGAGGGGFLFARIVASHLARFLAGDPGRPWQDQIPLGITGALDLDLADVVPGDDRPGTAGDLLAALAWAAGNGMPARGVWQAAARAVGGRETDYGPDDIDWLLQHYGRYIVEDSDGLQAVYRLYHRELVTHLRSSAPRPGADPAPLAIVRALVDLTLDQTAGGTNPRQANVYLRRHLTEHAVAADGPGITALRPLAEANPDAYLPDLASALNNLAIQLADVGRHQEALAPAQEATTTYRALTRTNPDAHLPDLAMALNNLAIQLAEVGRHQEALSPAQEATTTYRALTRTNPDAYLPNLAGALNTLANRLSDVGRRQEALSPAQEATTTYRALTRTNPDAYLPDLAMALNTLANRLSEVGRRQEAVAPAQEAVQLRRALARTNPDAYLPKLAIALNNLSIQLAEVGRHQEALAPVQEATTTYRALTRTNPDAYLPNLAGALNNLANRLSDMGRHQEALASAQEATTTYRALAHTNPDAYLPDLAMALNNLAIQLAEVGRRQEALAPAQEAATTYRALAHTNPDAHLPDLAMALSTLANRLSDVGRRQEALASAQEATTTYRTLTRTNPAAYLPNLATALNNLAIQLADAGRHQEALASAQEATTTYRALAHTNPDAYLPDLASALDNLGVRLSEMGRRQEALAPAQEAATAYRALAHTNPDAYLPNLAGTLNNLAIQLADAGRHQEALAPAQEATTTYRTLTRTNPDAYLPNLAGTLNNLAIQLANAGRHQEALASAQEATTTYRTLTRTNPDAYLPNLAGTLNNLANRLSEVGLHQEALASVQEATTTYRTLAHTDPDAHLPDLASTLDNLAGLLSEMGRHQEALQSYGEIIAAWPGPSWATAEIALHRALFLLKIGDTDSGIGALFELLAPGTSANGRTTFQVRRSLREVATSEPAAFRLHLSDHTDPATLTWLRVTDTDLRLTAEWINTKSWAESRDFVASHPDLLSTPARCALQEWALLDIRPAELHLALLDQLQAGVALETVYRPLVLPEILTTWIEAGAEDDGWASSATYLADHATDLLAPDADAALTDLGSGSPEDVHPLITLHRAILAMSVADGIEPAYTLLTDRHLLNTRIQRALGAADTTALNWLALIEKVMYGAVWSATVHLLAAHAVDDDATGPSPAEALRAAAQDTEPDMDDRNRAIAEIANLMSVHPTRAAALGELLQAVLAPPAQAPER